VAQIFGSKVTRFGELQFDLGLEILDQREFGLRDLVGSEFGPYLEC
jgi:hypothetical protein